MLADAGIGEWGFSALVEADGHLLLFDTGARPDTVLRNARELGVDLSQVTDVVLSHNHDDHTGGLVHLRHELSQRDAAALSRAHVAPGILWSRVEEGHEGNPMLKSAPLYLAEGGVFIEHKEPSELWSGVFLTGPVPRKYPERNWSGHRQVHSPSGLVEDNLPEDQALVIDTDRGLVVVTGCGHAGIINIVDFAQKQVRDAPIYAVLGGLHLLEADDARLDWTATELQSRGLSYLLGAHCTGLEALFHLRQAIGLRRGDAVVGAVGASFTLDRGIAPGRLAR
jgi:7,8-dihydropterin-6-yl-methyl-4-(beta-D-ribofuranosyl)aminobenzene 5'-phosphate synthase